MKKLFTKIVDAKPDELRALWLAFVFNFVVLAGYYILRPIREEIGATSGVENLPWMYTATLIGMLIANALFAAIVSRMSRRKFLPIAYRFAIANLFIFFILMRFVPANWQWLLARSFFVLVSVFNLFASTLKRRQPKNQSAEIFGTASRTSCVRRTCSRSSFSSSFTRSQIRGPIFNRRTSRGMSWQINRLAPHSSAKWISRSTRSLY